MKGTFQISEEMLKAFDNNVDKLVDVIISQFTKSTNHNTGWFARRKHPVNGNMEYAFDTRFGEKITNRKYIAYLLELKEDGWELAYQIIKY